MSWLEETHGTTFELMRHFLGRMLDGEWSSSRGEWQRVAVGAFALLIPAGLLLVRGGAVVPGRAAQYRAAVEMAQMEPIRLSALADQLALLTLVFAVTGLLGLMQWQSLFPGRRDYLFLAGLPVRSRQIFAARFSAVMLFSGALTVAMNILPSFVAPLERGLRWQRNTSYWAHVEAQGAASGLGGLFLVLGMVALQGALLNLLPVKWFARVTTWAQGLLTTILLLLALYSWTIRDWPAELVRQVPQYGGWAPPVWFLGLQQYLLGERDPFSTAMASRALTALAAAACLAVATYLMAYRRYRQLLVEAPATAEAASPSRWSMARLLARDPRMEGVLEFMAATLSRSRTHRVIWLAYLGAAIGVMLNSSFIDGAVMAPGREHWLERAVQFIIHFWPLGISVIALNGFHHVLSIPSEWNANWIFRLNEGAGRKYWMAAVERFIVAYAIVPVYLPVFPLAVRTLGWTEGTRMTLLEVLVTLTIFELRFYSWQQLPFTCSYQPGRQPLVLVAAKYVALVGVFVPAVFFLIAVSARTLTVTLPLAALFGAIWLWMRARRREGWGEATLLFETESRTVQSLGLSES